MAGKFKMYVDPFEVQVAKNIDFTDDLLKPVFARKDDWEHRANGKGRWWEYTDGTWLFLQNLEEHTSKAAGKRPASTYWVGSACRARTDELPQQVTKHGVSPLSIAIEDGGVLAHVAFLWEPERKLLWLQREREVGRTALMAYLRSQSGVAAGAIPIFETDAPAQAMKMKDVKKIDVTYIVGNQDAKPKGFFKTLKQLEGYGAATIEIKITPSRGNYLDAGAREVVKDIAGEVIGKTGTVQKAQIWGDLSKEDENVLVDLLRERSDYSTEVDKDKTSDPERLMRAVRNVWIAHRDDITVVKSPT